MQELRWPIHPHTTQMVRFKSSRSMSLQGCRSSYSEGGVSDVPLQYSNWQILVSLCDPLIFDGGTWTLCDVAVCSQVEKASWGKVRVLLFMSFRLYLTTSEYHTFIPIGFKDVCFQSLCLEIFYCWGRKTVVLMCRSWVVHFQDVGVSLEQWMSLIWLDWNFTSDTRLSESHLGFFRKSWFFFRAFLN